MLLSSDGYLEILSEFKDTTSLFYAESGLRQFVYLSLFFTSLRVLTLFFLSLFRNVVILREAYISLVFMFLGLSVSPSASNNSAPPGRIL